MTIDRSAAAALVTHETDTLADLGIGYPANHFAWRVILDSARERGARSLVEIGVGGGNGVPHVLAAGLDFAGIDNVPEKVDVTRAILRDLGGDPASIVVADAEDAASMAALPGAGSFDTLVGLGIMPHVDDRVCIPYLRENGNGIVEGGGCYRHKIKNTDIMSIYFIIVKIVN